MYVCACILCIHIYMYMYMYIYEACPYCFSNKYAAGKTQKIETY